MLVQDGTMNSQVMSNVLWGYDGALMGSTSGSDLQNDIPIDAQQGLRTSLNGQTFSAGFDDPPQAMCSR
jgi:hypothetical protein